MKLFARLFGPPTQADFAKTMMRTLKRGGETRTIEFDAERFSLRLGTTQTMYLQNAYKDYCAARWSQRKNVLAKYSAVSALPDQADHTFEQAKPHLLPRVRERFYYPSFELNIQIERAIRPVAGAKPVLENFVVTPLNDLLTLELVHDLPDAIKSVGKSELNEWGVTFEQGLVHARENLWRMSNKDFVRITPGLYVSPWQDQHDASRLILHDLIWQLPVNGQHIAAIPNRDLLIVTGSMDDSGLLGMAKLIDDTMKKPRPMTGTVFRLDGSRWVPFLPEEKSDAYWPLKRAAVVSSAQEFAEQCELLNTLFKKTGRDCFVAKLTVMQNNEGKLWTWTSWVEGLTDSLIPQAEYVLFGRMNNGKAERIGFGRWDCVRQVLGDLMEETAFYPPRWGLRSFPTADQLQEMESLRSEPVAMWPCYEQSGGEGGDIRQPLILQAQGQKQVPQLFQRDIGQKLGREIDRKLAVKGLKLIQERRAVPGFENADKFFDLV